MDRHRILLQRRVAQIMSILGFLCIGSLPLAHAADQSGGPVNCAPSFGYSFCAAYPNGELQSMSDITLLLDASGTSAGQTFTFTDKTLSSGIVFLRGAPSSLDFLGTNVLDGATLDGKINLADGNEGTLIVTNRGTVEQRGNGSLQLLNGLRLTNGTLSTYAIYNDKGIDGSSTTSFLNGSGATLVKYQGNGTSTIGVRFDQQNGKVESWSGQVLLNAGGSNFNGRFYADPLGANTSNYGIVFNGSHSFAGNTVTESGRLALSPGAAINADGTWNQRATFTNAGAIHIAAGAQINNTGSIEGSAASELTGSGVLNNQAAANFSSNVGADSTTGIGLVVVNAGEFDVKAGQSVVVNQFDNVGGVLRVNGEITTMNGHLNLVGGELRGSGNVNGDLFVGGGPSVATFNPGNSPGTLTVNGSFQLLAGGVLNLEVDRDSAGLLVWDRVLASGDITLNGTVNLLPGQGVSESDVAGLSFFGCSGAISCRPIVLGKYSLNQPLGWQLDILNPAPVPEPASGALALAGLCLLAFRIQRARHRQ